MKTFLNNFTSGEWTPLLDGRVDYERYQNACRKLENFTVLPYGGAVFRKGLELVAFAGPEMEGEPPPQVAPFVYSNDVKYLLVFEYSSNLQPASAPQDGGGEIITPLALEPIGSPSYNIRVCDTGGSFVAHIIGPWKRGIHLLKYRQINDVMYMAHPDYPVQKLTREADGWHLRELLFDNPPMLDENIDEESRIWFRRDAVDGVARPMTGVISANKDLFDPSHAGSYWELSQKNDADIISMSLAYQPGGGGTQTQSFFMRRAVSWTKTMRPVYDPATASLIWKLAWVIQWGVPALIGEDEYNNLQGGVFTTGLSGNEFDLNYVVTRSTYTLFSTKGVTDFSDPFYVRGSWEFSTTGHWWGTLEVERSFDHGVTWKTLRKYESVSDRSVNASGVEDDLCMLRVKYTSYGDPFGANVWTGTKPSGYATPMARLEFREGYTAGLVRVVEVLDTQNATVEVIRDLVRDGIQTDSSGAVMDNSTDVWREGAWSNARGFPAAVGMFEQRLFFANTRHRPNTIWASANDDFENFKLGSGEGDAFTITLAATEQNGIMWLESLRRLHAATLSRNFSVAGGEANGTPLSATNLLVRSENMRGADHLSPALIDDSIVYVARKGRSVFEMGYDIQRDAYVTQDVSLLAPHLLESGIRQIAYFANPNGCFYCVLGDGSMAVFSYMPNERVSAWSRWTPGGGAKFVSVCVLPGADRDDLWCIVSHKPGGWFLCRLGDGHLDLSSPSPSVGNESAALFHNAPFSEGARVDCVVNGNIHLRDCVIVDGRVIFPHPVENAQTCVIGLPYRGILQPMKLEVILQTGPTAGQKRRISKVVGRFHGTVSCKMGPSLDRLSDVDFRTTRDRMDAVNPPFTGDVPLAWSGGSSRDESIVLVNDSPFPCTVLGLSVSWEAFGD